MKMHEAIEALLLPENIKTKCIRPVAWQDCYDHFILDDGINGEWMLCYESEYYDPYESNPFYIPYYVGVLTGEWQMCDIPALPDDVPKYEENEE